MGGSMPLDEPEGWRWLWERAQQETDPTKLAELIDQLNQLLTAHEKAALEEEKPASRSRRKSSEQSV